MNARSIVKFYISKNTRGGKRWKDVNPDRMIVIFKECVCKLKISNTEAAKDMIDYVNEIIKKIENDK